MKVVDHGIGNLTAGADEQRNLVAAGRSSWSSPNNFVLVSTEPPVAQHFLDEGEWPPQHNEALLTSIASV